MLFHLKFNFPREFLSNQTEKSGKMRNLISRARLKHSAASSKSLSLRALEPLSIKSSENSKDFSSEEESAEVSAPLLMLLLQVDSVPPWALDSMVASLEVSAFGARVSSPFIVTEASDSDVGFWLSFSSTIAFLKWEGFVFFSFRCFKKTKNPLIFVAEKVIYSEGVQSRKMKLYDTLQPYFLCHLKRISKSRCTTIKSANIAVNLKCPNYLKNCFA